MSRSLECWIILEQVDIFWSQQEMMDQYTWDTTGRSPKVSSLKQHSAPTTGVCFSPSNDKMVVSVGLDKKLYTFDPGMKKPAYCTPCEAPFSSLAFKDDGLILAAGTNIGWVVFRMFVGNHNLSQFFGFLGVVATLVFSCMGVAYGTTKSGVGVASMGVMRAEYSRYYTSFSSWPVTSRLKKLQLVFFLLGSFVSFISKTVVFCCVEILVSQFWR